MGRRKKDFSKSGVFGNGGNSGNASANIIDDMDKAAFSATGSSVEDEILSALPSRPFKSILQEHNGQIQRGNFVLTMTGMEYEGDELTLDEWKEIGSWLNQLKDSIQWMIGDWANMGKDRLDTWVDPDGREFRTRYAELLDKTEYSYSSLRKFSSVAEKFPMFRRRNTLTYSHHAEVAHLSEPEQDRFLDMAESNDIRDVPLPVRKLRELVQAEYPPQIKSGGGTPIVSNEARVLLTRGLEIISLTPTLNEKNRDDAIKAAEFYREIAEKLEQYASQENAD